MPKTSKPTIRTRTFDARPDRLDLRDLPYRAPLKSLPPRYPDDAAARDFIAGYVAQGLVLDQGTEGACTGFGLAGVVNYLFWVRYITAETSGPPFKRVSPRMLYELAKRYDEWPGQDYEGSSCRGALKGWHKHGVCGEELWPYPLDADGKPVFARPLEGWDADAATRPLGVYYRIDRASVVDVQAALADIGAVYVSAEVHDGWDTLTHARATAAPESHAALPVIPAPKKPGERGGHAFALVGYNERGFVVQNSWGEAWGAGGFGVLPYEDWVEHVSDAWACALGVPVQLSQGKGEPQPLVASRWRVASGRSLATLERAARDPHNPADDPWPVDRSFDFEGYEPWPTHDAYVSTLVSGNDGRLVVSDLTRAADDAAGHAQDIVRDAPLRWSAGARRLKLALYAHGGLNHEDESIRRIRVLAPYFAANGVYPLFLTWKTGIGETLGYLAEDWARRILGADVERAGGILELLGDAKDRAVEALAHVLGRGVWNQMRENAALALRPGHCLDLLALNLVELGRALRARGTALDLHLVGHSAGAILLGHLLERLMQPDLAAAAPKVRTCTLFAPACSTRFAMERYAAAADAGLVELDRLALYVLSDGNEKRDGLPSPEVPAYGKSLLYLVSRALHDKRKMPLLGMERALLAQYANDSDQWAEDELATVRAWQARFTGTATTIAAPEVRDTKLGHRIQSTHGSFDNNIDALTETLQRIAGKRLVAPMEWLDYE